jgi:hypothetical protein
MSKTRKRIKEALMAGAAMYGAAKLFGGNKMISGKDSEVGAIAAQKNKLRVPASMKNRKKFKDAFMPKGNIMGQDFGIDPFGPGMGAKKGKMIKAMGGTMVTRGQGQVMRTKKTKII